MNRLQRKFVLDALRYESYLNDWESQFINDLAERDENNREFELSEKQNHALNLIHDKLQNIW